MDPILALIILYVFAIVITPSLILCMLLVRFGPKDFPDTGRKNQKKPVATMGGLSFLIPVFGIVALIWGLDTSPLISVVSSGEGIVESHAQELTKWGLWGYVALVLGACLVGMADDIRGLSAKPKMLILFFLAMLAPLVGLHFEYLYLPILSVGELTLMPVLSILGCGLWLFVMMNAVNFMDGSNGLAMGSLAIMLLGLGFLGFDLGFWSGAADYVSTISFLLACSIAGFLIWNLRGKLYAGDTGALTGGALFASLSLLLIAASRDAGYHPLSVWTPATLALPFLIDVFLTLVWRVKHGENILHPHRNHAYQLLLRKGWGHIRTAVLWWGMSALCVAAGVRAALTGPDAAFWTFWALLAVGIMLWIVQRRVLWPQVVAREAAQ